MNDLIVLIRSMQSDEAEDFIAFAKAKNQRSDVKNIKLFDLIRSGVRRDLDLKIYGKRNNNALNALKNRLKENLIDFTASRGFSNESLEELQLLKLLLAARIFLEKEQFSIGFKTLHKVIRSSSKLESYAILQECYHTYVQYAHLDPKCDLEELIAAYNRIQSLYETEIKWVKLYAILKRELTQNPSNSFDLIKEKLEEYELQIDASLSFKTLFQIMNIVTDAATLESDYAGVSLFMNHVFELVKVKKHLADKHLYYHCEILYLMSGTYFRNRDFMASQKILTELEVQLSKQRGAFELQFRERVLLLKALNFNYTNKPLEAMQLITRLKKPTTRIVVVHAMLLFQQTEFNAARRKLNELKHTDRFYERKEGLLFVLYKNILEILIYMELSQPDLVESKMRSFKKRYKNSLLGIKEERVITFMKLLRNYFDEPYLATQKTFKDRVEQAFIWKPADREDIFVMSFYAYLKAKMERKTIFQATMDLVAQGSNS
ncbi:hypothetical protein [Nonlabens sp. YIK11]|uniref:hypothetical protein n=1 Tax=Nonlabens sp. YIK11 TaxID=1453349 RepID=UPI000AE364B2|nr:hypothetical protein [Nonlabens sp. YIK11]